MNFSSFLIVLLALVVGALIGIVVGAVWARSRSAVDLARAGAQRDAASQRAAELTAARTAEQQTAHAQLTQQSVVKAGLTQLSQRLDELNRGQAAFRAGLAEQMESVRRGGEGLQRETAALSVALRKPQVRGRWGELQLRRSVELAGMLDHCDFTEQQRVPGDSGVLRPDLVVHLPGDRQLVVDSKVPLSAFLEAAEATDDAARSERLSAHARQLRTHVDQLASKAYWRSLRHTPDFVLMFLPGEQFLSAALEVEPGLLEYAAERRVLLVSPVSLIGTLRTIAYGWQQAALTESAHEVFRLGRELYDRLGTMGTHLDKLGRSLNAAVDSFNGTVGSLETRVLPSARKLRDLNVTAEELAPVNTSDATPRRLSAPELLDEILPVRAELPLDDLEDEDRPSTTDTATRTLVAGVRPLPRSGTDD